MTLAGTAAPRAFAAWRIAYWVLAAIFLATAALNLLHVRAGFWTSHAADLFVPPWLYIVIRGLGGVRRPGSRLLRWLGSTPALAAGSLFVASALTEVSQISWPRGFFAGVFDPLDIAAYAAGLLPCYLLDRSAG